jgi:hypothetical protein
MSINNHGIQNIDAICNTVTNEQMYFFQLYFDDDREQ